jgi:hypothetical protein
MSLYSELTYITNPPGKPSTRYREVDGANQLLKDLKAMQNGARAELVKELFASMPSKIEQTQLLVQLSDTVNA